MVSPPGAHDYEVGFHRPARLERHSPVAESLQFIPNNCDIALMNCGPKIWQSDDTKTGVCPENTMEVSVTVT